MQYKIRTLIIDKIIVVNALTLLIHLLILCLYNMIHNFRKKLVELKNTKKS